MLANGALGTGISAHKRANDLSDFGDELDMIEELGVEAIELPTYDMDIVVGGRIRRPQMEALRRACAGRDVIYSVHGPLSINFMDEAWRLPRHMEALKASLEVAAEVGAEHYVIHSGLLRQQQGEGHESAYMRQREWLSKAGDVARENGLLLCVETLFAGYDGKAMATSASRLARELAAIAHPNVLATLDFSHALLKLDYDGRRDDFLSEIKALAPWSKHLHIHDSFGRQDDIWMFTDGERVAYGHGDLHLPVGWGDIPWDRIVEECEFPEGVLFNIELKERYWYAAQETVEATKALAQAARTAPRAIAA
ncbi:sugar phosphate isomerase/epimerase [Pseudaminobacter sp. 19-2017]|uniref:Sugar phosphate isomerase/epimerase n=1 Tax=Pseudaminobacter soli (ex Zhang et al. 2022) TaxID=2831468 RepID=A0A942DYX1_9HYPH|nr:sugar phosphate isomerase/epimerase [Pseudaminobacter soli]MBS3650549.1 sugar phosphate isomerase/epimerase [Pseudaminobacter soli]